MLYFLSYKIPVQQHCNDIDTVLQNKDTDNCIINSKWYIISYENICYIYIYIL